jgi:homoserine dehydrogenase
MSDSTTVNIGLCGLGTVGQGVWKHITANRVDLESRVGVKLNLARVAVRDLRKARGVKIPASKLTDDPLAVAKDPSIQIVCELMGGTGIAREVTLAALKAGKIVVSANKALICEHGAEIFAAAQKHGGHFFFEASVAGGIPTR